MPAARTCPGQGGDVRLAGEQHRQAGGGLPHEAHLHLLEIRRMARIVVRRAAVEDPAGAAFHVLVEARAGETPVVSFLALPIELGLTEK